MLECFELRLTPWRCIGLSLTFALLFPVSLRAQHTRNVLLVHEGNATHPGNLITSEVFREAFAVGSRIQFFEEYIDEDRLDVTDDRLAESLRQKYLGKQMDLVIGEGRPALNFFLQRGQKLWPGVPTVFYFVDSRELPPQLPSNMTGIASTVDYGAILDLALRLQPNTRRVFYVGGVNSWEDVWRGFAEQDFKRFAGRVEITYLNKLPLPELLDRLSRLPANSVVIYSEILRDASGHVYVPGRVCPLIASASVAPVYGPFDTYLGCGIVGGVILDIKDVAARTADLGLRVLERGSASGFPVESLPNKTLVDWRQLRRWGISERRLPPGTIVQFRQLSTWEVYRSYILAGLLFLLLETALVAILLLARRREKRTRKLLERRFAIEKTVAECSTRLSDCPPGRVDAEIEDGLRAILVAEAVDRASWFVMDDSGPVVRDVYSVHGPKVNSEAEFYTRPELPWVTETLLQGKTIAVSKLEHLPAEAQTDKLYFEKRQVRAVALIPSHPSDAARGVLVLVCLASSREWPRTLISRLGVLGNIFAGALARKQAQEARQESEQRFRYLFTEAPIGIALEDSNGRILFANPALCSMLGYTMEEMCGMLCAQLADAEDEEEDWRYFQAMQAGITRSYQLEKRYTRKDGGHIWGRLNVSLLDSSGQAPLVLVTVEDITEKKAAMDDLRVAHAELRQLPPRLIQAQEEERQRIARELHDDIGQRLSLVMLDLDRFRNEMPIERAVEHKKIIDLLGQIDELVTDVHNMSHQLHSSKLQHLGLGTALKEVCRQVSRQHHVRIDLTADQFTYPLSEQVSLCFYRVAQEALNNATKHSRSPRIEVRLTNGAPLLRLQVTDFGIGFDPAIQSSGLGLATMQERLRMIGGMLRVDSSPGAGTQLVAEADTTYPSASAKVA